MGSGGQRKKKDSETPSAAIATYPSTGGEIAGMAVSKLLDIVKELATKGLNPAVAIPGLLILVGAYVALEIVNGAGAGAGFVMFAKVLLKVAGSSFVAFGGWALSAMLLVTGYLYFGSMKRRIEVQGEVNAKLKDQQDPPRLSSTRREELELYATKGEDEILQEFAIPKRRKKRKRR